MEPIDKRRQEIIEKVAALMAAEINQLLSFGEAKDFLPKAEREVDADFSDWVERVLALEIESKP